MFSKLIFPIIITAFLFTFYAPAKAAGTEDTNMALMKRFFTEIINKGNLDLIDELCDEKFTEHEDLPIQASGREGLKKFFQMYRTAFPDLKFEVEMMIAKDDKVISYITISGTQKGSFMDMPASGKKFSVKGIDIVRFKDSKAMEHWGVTDSMTMMQQLGAIPDR